MPQPTTEQGLPVAGLASTVLAEMKKLGYAESSLNTYRSIFDKMTAYFEDKGIGTFSLEQGHAFVLDYCGDRLNDDKTFKNYFRAIHMAGDYQRYGMIFRQTQAGKKDFTEGFKPLADSFLDSLAKTGRIADGTLYSYRKKLFRFEGFLLDRGVDSISKVTGHHIDVYVETLAGYSKNTISFSLTCLRRLLDFAYTNGYIAQQLSVRVPDVRYRQSSRLPATVTPEETERILKNIDNNNPVGKRNYAMILMYARYGMRPSTSWPCSSGRWTGTGVRYPFASRKPDTSRNSLYTKMSAGPLSTTLRTGGHRHPARTYSLPIPRLLERWPARRMSPGAFPVQCRKPV